MPSREMRFESAGHTLSGRLEHPPGLPRAYAVFAHCFTCGKDIAAASRVSRALTDAGIAVLRFDFTGLGNSDGDFGNAGFSSNVADLVAAAEHLRRTHEAPQLLVGHSLGGAAVLAAAPQIPEVRAVATIGAPSRPEHVEHLFAPDALETIEAEGSAEVRLGTRTFRIQKPFLDDLRRQGLDLRGLGRALLVLHSPRDEIVAIDEASKIFLQAKHPKSFVSLDPADHLLTKKADAVYAARTIAAWASRWLPEAPAEEDAPETHLPHGQARVTTAGRPFLNRVQAGTHGLLADEPVAIGGKDEGPSPYEYLLGGLGACTSMTLEMYARRKGIPLEGVSVELQHDRVEGDPPEGTLARGGKYERITRRVRLSGDLDDATRARLLEIANKCPVHRTLESRPEVVTELES